MKLLRIRSKYICGSIGEKKLRTFSSYNDWVKWEQIYHSISSYGGMRNQSELTDSMFQRLKKKVIYKSLQKVKYKEMNMYDDCDSDFLYPIKKRAIKNGKN